MCQNFLSHRRGNGFLITRDDIITVWYYCNFRDIFLASRYISWDFFFPPRFLAAYSHKCHTFAVLRYNTGPLKYCDLSLRWLFHRPLSVWHVFRSTLRTQLATTWRRTWGQQKTDKWGPNADFHITIQFFIISPRFTLMSNSFCCKYLFRKINNLLKKKMQYGMDNGKDQRGKSSYFLQSNGVWLTQWYFLHDVKVHAHRLDFPLPVWKLFFSR